MSCYNETVPNNKAIVFLRLSRPFFLLGGLLQYLVGVSMAILSGAIFSPIQFAIGLLLVFTIQLMVHFSNEYFDREVDRSPAGKRTWFTGGSGVLSADELAPAAAIRAARIWAIVSLVILVIIAFRTPWLAVMGVLVLLVSWFYSAPPLRLVGRGVGSLIASVILCFFVPLTGMGMQDRLSSSHRCFSGSVFQ